ncbi:ABC transporter ATP-binding protein [Halobacillus sp. B23F22_1]|uniref:ABC transporter ATP-binding protein n=1 Tax=Halobacillus sp. B23F22_1 TaxID=3459514 RepID=UPI00373F2832
MIKINNLQKSYGSNEVLRGLDLEVEKGSIYGIVGTNGAGKTTLLEIMTGFTKADSGTMTIDGVKVTNQSDTPEQLSFIPDTPALYEYLSGEEYLLFAASMFDIPKGERKSLADKFLHLFGLNSARNELIKTYSNGMKQKISIAAAIINDPKIILLDEPLTGIDMISTQVIKEYLQDFSKENTVVLTTHLIELAHSLCDKIGILHNGEIVEEFSTSATNIRSLEEHIREVYIQRGNDYAG